ncbi:MULTISPECIES: VWA domain-containing protein [Myxococcus]|uniref:vWA domain-containing protein n=1 Tax=Myxococcus TaxID=32 RepID=UPI00114321BD|nr:MULTISPECIES: VWA domain-containing protein [Myxococcus]NOK04117.1 M48 family metalloprotease [Myxococcus xanthus]
MSPSRRHITPEEVATGWRDALALWDVRVQLSPPEPHVGFHPDASHAQEPLAYIDLVKRQVFVNFKLLEAMEATDSLAAVLAHEIGHHARFPHTLGWDAELRVQEQRLVPGLKQSLTNLFYDLQVNEVVGRTHAEALCAVYRGFQHVQGGEMSPLFFFYLAIYEELWGLPPGNLVPAAQLEPMEQRYPGVRAEARMFAQTFYALPSGKLQFLYFCATFIRYIEKPADLEFSLPLGGDVSVPDVDDLDAAIHGSSRWDDALNEAEERGWLEPLSTRAKEKDELDSIHRVTEHLPGKQGGKLRRALVAKHYRRLVDRHILKLPTTPSQPEPYLRTTPQAWEYGDDPSSIDWTLTVLSQGHLAAVSPLRRELEADLPPPSELGVPSVEIYLDTSGSMPNPELSLNAMTLAAQVLSASALRKKATVRGIVYSHGDPQVSPWMYDEEKARDFLLGYIGGGTQFPFDVMDALSRERPDALRIIISDSDFLANVTAEKPLAPVLESIRRSRLVVAILAVPDELRARQALAPLLRERRFRLVVVRWPSDFAKAAADLAQALLEN